MKKLIAVRGVAERGKSSSIKMVYQMLKTAYPRAEIRELFVGVDITVVITVNGVKVGIESQGDPNSRLKESLNLFVKIGCEVIICATRTRGMTVNWVEEKQPPYDIIWKAQKAAATIDSQDVANSQMAKEIVAEAEKVINA